MVLKYTSPALNLSFEKKFICSRALLEHNIILEESYDTRKDQYCLQLSVDVKNNEDLEFYKDQFRKLIQRINISLIYITLHAVDSPPCKYNYDKREYTLLDYSSVYEWRSNFNEIWNIFYKNEPHLLGETYQTIYKATDSPFEDILLLIQPNCIIHIEGIYKELVYWHRESLLVEGDIRLLIASKALEILRTLIPDIKTNQGIPEEIIKCFEANGKSINWLYDMSNNRRETRHAVIPGKPISKDRMDNDEYLTFVKLSNYLIVNWIRHMVGLQCYKLSKEE